MQDIHTFQEDKFSTFRTLDYQSSNGGEFLDTTATKRSAFPLNCVIQTIRASNNAYNLGEKTPKSNYSRPSLEEKRKRKGFIL